MKSKFWVTSFLFFVFVIFSIEANAQINLNNGLVGYFAMDSNSIDQSPIAINGVVNNAVLTTGKNNNPDSAYYFNGINANINCTANSRNITSVVTVSVWVKTTSTANQFVVNKYDYTIDKGFHITIFNGHPILAGRNNGGAYVTTNYPNPVNLVNDGQWHHIVGEISGNSWKLWVDCVLDNQVTSNAQNPTLVTNSDLTIGNYIMPTGVLTGYVNGSIDEVRIYNRLLTVAEKALICDINYVDSLAAEPIVSNDTTVCDTTVLSLFATSDTGTIYWESPLGTIVDSGNVHTDTMSQSTTYYVYSLLNGIYSDTAIINVTAIFCDTIIAVPVVSSDTIVCDSSMVTLFANPDTGMVYWESPLGTLIDSGNVHTGLMTQSTVFYVYSVLNGYYSDTAIINVTVVNCDTLIAAPTVINDTTVCMGDSFTIVAVPDTGMIYWEYPVGNIVDSGNIVTLSLSQSTTVFVYSVLNGVYSATSVVSVTVINCDTIIGSPMVINDTTVCKGDLFTLVAIPDTGLIYWEYPIGNIVDSGNIITLSLNQSTNIFVYSFLNGFYSDTMVVIVTVIDCDTIIPIVSTSNDTLVCENTILTFYTNADTGTIYWESPQGVIVDSGNFHISTITQDVNFYVYSVLDGRVSDTSIIEVTTTTCDSVIHLTTIPDTLICENEAAQIVFSYDSGIVHWESPLGNLIGLGDTLNVKVVESQEVFLYVVFSSSVSDTIAFRIVTTDCGKAIFPNIFTPNGDGVNDYLFFKIPNVTCFKGVVYNRWGTLVYEFTDITDGWDGRVRDSQTEVPDGVYFYVIEYCANGSALQVKKGNVTLIR